ncbi:hypothetical protein CEXT_120091 [Caerostris extrusa]|uniref:Uncharacterized protein n=1 Tax=Caerostris extrusa TaxID=172846 RepID=A0AAV4RH03_CAEEX|nr:hypothetical protein CEXT_120091 [Caerostris extrusa]
MWSINFGRGQRLAAPTCSDFRESKIKLHKWCSNHSELSSNLEEDYTSPNPFETKTLVVSCKPIKNFLLTWNVVVVVVH